MPIVAGTRLGRYEVRSQIGAGGMGEVYLAQDTMLERTVALKVLPADIAADKDRMQRFIREAKTASALNHPNILTIHEIGQQDEHHFIATEYIEGESLRQHMTRSRMELREVLDVISQVASALSAAHQAGIIHRDIKPENIMLRRDGLIKVLDFGLAKLADVTAAAARQAESDTEAPTMTKVFKTEPGRVMGTASYMSPEQARGLEVDSRTDMWSLGIVLYEMVSGRLPFEGATTSDVIATILHREPPSLLLYRSDMPAELERIVEKALTKGPDERYQTAKDVSLDLKRLRQRLEVEAELERNITPEEGAWRASGRFSAGSSQAAISGKMQAAAAAPAREASAARQVSSAEYLVGEIKRHKTGAALGLAGVVGAAALAVTFWPRTPPAPPKITGSTQITRDNRRKDALVTDGTRLYYSQFEGQTYEVSVGGGEAIPLITGLKSTVVDVSPDGAELLLLSGRFSGGSHSAGLLFAQPVVGGSARRVGNQLASGAAWSPDRRQIALGSGSDVLIASADGSEARKLASVDGIVEELSWSPDASRIRFTVFNLKDYSSALWEVAADGSGLRALQPDWNRPADECCGRWTPDGRYYVFQSTRNGATNIWVLRDAGGPSQRTESEPAQLTFGPVEFFNPAPSRDGKKLFAVGEFRRGEIVRYDARSGQLHPFMPGLSAEQLDFSKDGQWIVYVAYPEATLWRSRVDGTERLQLTTPPMRVGLPRWSPDGKRIVFAASSPGSEGRTWKSYVIPALGGAPQPVAPDERNDSDPTWSRDGNQVAFGYTWEQSRSEHGGGIQIVDLRTAQVSRLPGSERMFSPRWSPNGRSISALSIDLTRLMVFDLATQKWAEVAHADLFWPSWSPDGQYISFYTDLYSYTAGAVSAMRVRVSDHKIEQVASIKGIEAAFGVFGRWVGQAPDGSPLLLRDTGAQEIYALDVQFP